MTERENEQIRKSVYIAAGPERIFEAVTTAEDWDRFFTSGMELDPKPGGSAISDGKTGVPSWFLKSRRER